MTALAALAYLAAIIAGVTLSMAVSVPYIRDTVRGIRNPLATRGITKPQAVSWAIWAGIMAIGGASSLTARQWPSAGYTLACSAECGLIALLALRIPARYRDPPVRVPLPRGKAIRLDLICCAGGVAGLSLLALAHDPAAAVTASVATDVIAYIPTMVHAWQEPHEETWLTYAGYAAGALLSLAAVAIRDPGNLLTATAAAYPAYLLVADGSVAVMIRFRRRAARGPIPWPDAGGASGAGRAVVVAAGPGVRAATVSLLESVSPYGSRRVRVEYDGVVTAAYLDDGASVKSAVWIANHQAAPRAPDWERLDAGWAPLMPAACTKHPGGRPPLAAGALQALWLEEGDGVAILENGRPAAVIPGWADADRGIPGYGTDVIGRTPYGWSLDDAIQGLAARLERAGAYWRWRQSAAGWDQVQQALLGHLSLRVGPGGPYWDVAAGQQPLIRVTERPATGRRPYTVLSTVGMSCQRMPAVEQVTVEPGRHARIELAVATTLPSVEAARALSWLAPYPWQQVTWLGPGHCVRWDGEPSAFPLGAGDAVLLLDSPGVLTGPCPPDLSGFTFAGDPVRWLWIIPILEQHWQIAKHHGTATLISQLAAQQRAWITGPALARP